MRKKNIVLGSGKLDIKKWDWKDFKCDYDDYY
jgi:hypothetical protein